MTHVNEGDLPAGRAFAPGIYLGVDGPVYHHHPSVSKSDLDLIARSPAHYKHAKQQPSSSTPAQRFGTAVHCAVLEPDAFDQRYEVVPAAVGSTRTKAYATWLADVREHNPDIEPLTLEERDRVFWIRDVLGAHPTASTFVGPHVPGPREASVLWERDVFVNHDHGTRCVRCRCRPDALPDGYNAVVDLKTTGNASPEEFTRSILRFRYHMAAAWYLAGMAAVGKPCDTYLYVVVESEAPFGVGCYTIPDDLIEHAAMQIEVYLHRYALCEATDSWPAYAVEVRELEFGPWAYRSAA